jgi:hypothetical protein
LLDFFPQPNHTVPNNNNVKICGLNLVKINNLNSFPKHATAVAFLFTALLTLVADADIILYDTTFAEGAGNVLDKGDNQAVRDDTLWQAANGTGWTHGVGNSWIFNTQTGDGSPPDGSTAEGPLFKILNLSGKGLTNENALNLSFNYSAWGAAAGTGQDDLYIHVWGFKDVSSTSTTVVADLVSQEGNSWGALTGSEYDDLTRYNLKDGSVLSAGNSSNAASRAITMENISLSVGNDGTQANASFRLNSTGTLSNYDYLAVSFTRNVAGQSGEGFAIRDFNITAVPEPSSLSMLGLTLLSLSVRRRRKSKLSR